MKLRKPINFQNIFLLKKILPIHVQLSLIWPVCHRWMTFSFFFFSVNCKVSSRHISFEEDANFYWNTSVLTFNRGTLWQPEKTCLRGWNGVEVWGRMFLLFVKVIFFPKGRHVVWIDYNRYGTGNVTIWQKLLRFLVLHLSQSC